MDAAVPRRAALLAGSRYELLVKIATGGTATVYVGRLTGSVGFSRLVAIKRAHPHLRDDATARAGLIREARLAARVHHANVVPIHDVEETEDELLLVMDYVEGGALSDLLEASAGPLPAPIALRVVLDACAGLSAVHALKDESGRDVGMVHRDVSPQNILVGLDGTARLTDFGLARLTEVSTSATATVKGKIAYMAPEYIEGGPPTRRSDVFSMGVVVWEALSGRRLFRGSNDADTLRRVVSQPVPRVSTLAELPDPFDAVLARALTKEPHLRYPSIQAFGEALADVAKLVGVAVAADVGCAVRKLVGKTLTRRRETVRLLDDPENATGSMLLDELPFVVRAASPPVAVTVPGAPPLREVAPTIPLDAVAADAAPSSGEGDAALEEGEADTLRQARNGARSRPLRSERRRIPLGEADEHDVAVRVAPAGARAMGVFVAPPLAALVVVLAVKLWRGGEDGARREATTRVARAVVGQAVAPGTLPSASAAPAEPAPAEPAPAEPAPAGPSPAQPVPVVPSSPARPRPVVPWSAPLPDNPSKRRGD